MQHAALLCCGVPVHGIAPSQGDMGFVLFPSCLKAGYALFDTALPGTVQGWHRSFLSMHI